MVRTSSAKQKKGRKNMKIIKIGGVLLLAAAAVFFGFHFFFAKGDEQVPMDNEGDDVNPYVEELAYYRAKTEQLETELSQLKQEQYTAQKEYEERISELELLLRAEEESTEPPASATYTYTVSENTVTITGYSGNETRLVIPDNIDGLPVSTIGREAFKNSILVEVVIPDSVKKIDWFAFYGSRALTSVTIPSSVSKIEYGVFDGCEALTIHCERNSYADKYARSYGMRVSN